MKEYFNRERIVDYCVAITGIVIGFLAPFTSFSITILAQPFVSMSGWLAVAYVGYGLLYPVIREKRSYRILGIIHALLVTAVVVALVCAERKPLSSISLEAILYCSLLVLPFYLLVLSQNVRSQMVKIVAATVSFVAIPVLILQSLVAYAVFSI